ncbi:MAG: hypothetical protein Q8R13_02205, partial [bacterium]|nr:hypothetical protein [bacterium]
MYRIERSERNEEAHLQNPQGGPAMQTIFPNVVFVTLLLLSSPALLPGEAPTRQPVVITEEDVAKEFGVESVNLYIRLNTFAYVSELLIEYLDTTTDEEIPRALYDRWRRRLLFAAAHFKQLSVYLKNLGHRTDIRVLTKLIKVYELRQTLDGEERRLCHMKNEWAKADKRERFEDLGRPYGICGIPGRKTPPGTGGG